MRKLTFLLTCLFLVGVGLVNAQTKSISGKVLSAEDGQPIIGATIKVKGSTVGTITNVDGEFKISLQGNSNDLLVSYVGMRTVNVQASNNMVVKLEPDAKQIDEIVVTAMGIKRSEKSLGYAASTIKSDALNRATPLSVTNGLTGKVAGLNISSSGGTGTSEKVIIRGITSFTNNQPLYVVDGIPIQNSFMGKDQTNQAVDFGNQAGDINPDDVASVTVLKGASSTALYGSRAANGVILITTKRGSSDSKMKVSYSGTATVSNVLRTPQLENRFGQGWPLLNQAGTPEPGLGENGSWGPQLDGLMRKWGAPLTEQGIYSSTGTQRVKPFSYVKNNLRDFYENGLEVTNNISVSAGNQYTSFIFSYNNVNSDGVLPSNADKYNRNTFSVRGDANYKKFHANIDINYVRKDINQVRDGQGGATGATIFQDIIQTPVDVNFADLKDFQNPYNNIDNYYTGYAQNPYWIIANNQSKYQDDRVYGKVELSYDIIHGLKALGRLGADFTNSRTKSWAAQVMQSPNGWAMEFSSKSIPGNYEEDNVSYGQLDATAMLSADYSIGTDFRITGNAGWNLNQRSKSEIDAIQGALDVPNWYNLINGTSPATINATVAYPSSNRRLIGLFLQGDVSYKDWAFLGLSARNDWSSTLPVSKNNFFYGGVNASVILTDAITSIKGDVLNFLKLRAGLGQTGNDASVYLTNNKFLPTQITLGFGNLYLPLSGVSGLTESNTLGNQSLKPEITTETEFGLDMKLFDSRLGLDLAWYNRDTKNQIINAAISPESGYTGKVRNVGWINNKGLEVHLYGSPLKNKNFEWELGVTFAKNWSLVKELWDNVQNYQWTSAYDVTYMMLKGQPVGMFQVPKARTVTDTNSPYFGKVVVNSSGIPQIVANEYTTIGSSNPDFTMGLTSSWRYKSFSLNVVLDYRQGGYFYSNTARMLDWNGNGTNTMFNDRQPFLVPNSVKEISTGVYADNDIPLMTTGGVLNYWNYSSSNKSLESNSVLSRTYLKLREVSLSYVFPKKWLAKTFISDAQISLIGRNLLMWTAAQNNFVDPDQTNYGNDITSNFGEFSSAPSVRNLGASLKLNF
jgi:TonB-linked SusC/RagA family outer membrane protein